MGVLKRFADIMKANVNAMLEGAEDPVKMANQYLLDAREDLRKLRQETVELMAEESRAKRAYENNQGQIERFENLAKKAVAGGNDGDARIFIEKKQSLEKNEEVLRMAYATAKENAEKIKLMHDKLVDDIRTLEDRKRVIEQKVAIAEAAERTNRYKISNERYDEALGAFARMEAKADKLLDEAKAHGALLCELDDKAEKLEANYISEPNDVDKELEEMKKAMEA